MNVNWLKHSLEKRKLILLFLETESSTNPDPPGTSGKLFSF